MAPKKKKKAAATIGMFDIDLLTDNELKQYIEALKTESKNMRQSFAEHQKDNLELHVHSEIVEDRIEHLSNVLNEKESELKHLVAESQRSFQKERANNVSHRLKCAANAQEETLAQMQRIVTADAEIREKRGNLMSLLEDADKRLDRAHQDRMDYQMSVMEKEQVDAENSLKPKLIPMKQSTEHFLKEYNGMNRDFHSNKTKILNEILLNDNRISTNQAVAEDLEKMSLYFKNIFSENGRTTKDLLRNIASLETELNKLKSRYNQAKSENRNRKNRDSNRDEPESDQSDTETVVVDTLDSQVDKLVYDNDVIKMKLDQEQKILDELENSFLKALRKTQWEVDFRKLLEKLKSFVLDEEN